MNIENIRPIIQPKQPAAPKVPEYVTLEDYPHEELFRSFLDEVKNLDTSANDGYIELETLKKLYKQILGDGALADNTFDYRIQQIMKGITTDDLDAGIFSEPNENGVLRYFINTKKTKLLDQIFKHNIYDTDFRLLQDKVREIEDGLGIYPADNQDLED